MNPNPRHAFTLVEIIILVAILLIFFVIPASRFGEAQTRSIIGRAQADQRGMATALASYFADHDAYPLAMVADFSAEKLSNDLTRPFAIAAAKPVFEKGSAAAKLANDRRPAFALSVASPLQPGGFASLTTPVAYMTTYFADPFSPDQALTHSYLPDRKGFLLATFPISENDSPAAEGLADLVVAMRGQFIRRKTAPFDGMATAESRPRLRVGELVGGRAYTYDPTNGTKSAGTVYRVSD